MCADFRAKVPTATLDGPSAFRCFEIVSGKTPTNVRSLERSVDLVLYWIVSSLVVVFREQCYCSDLAKAIIQGMHRRKIRNHQRMPQSCDGFAV